MSFTEEEVTGTEKAETETTETTATTVTTEAVKVDELQEDFMVWLDGGLSEDDVIEILHTKHNLSYPAAVNRLRALKKGAGLTRQKGAKSEDVRAFMQECHDAGDERAVIVDKLVEKYGYTKKSAQSVFSTQGKAIGIAGEGGFGGGQKKPLNEVVEFARGASQMKRAEFTAAMVEQLGYTESTAGAFYTYMGFAKEYARQEVDAAS